MSLAVCTNTEMVPSPPAAKDQLSNGLKRRWWTTDEHGSSYLPTRTSHRPTQTTDGHSSGGSGGGGGSSNQGTITSGTGGDTTRSGPSNESSPSTSRVTTFISSFPTTVISDSTTFTTLTQTTIHSTLPPTAVSSSSASADMSTTSPSAINENSPVCIGHGLDSSALGILSALVIPTAIGLLIWVLFAILRPRFRQVYASREWFVQPDLRPKPLPDRPWSFLSPPVPLIPDLPAESDVADSRSTSSTPETATFTSDEQISQRILWIAFTIVLGWSILALGGLLPLFLVKTPCLAEGGTEVGFGSGAYSTLQDLSLLRLLKYIDSSSSTSSSSSGTLSLVARSVDGPRGLDMNPHVRVIVLTALTVFLGILPPLIKVLREHNRLVNYRDLWVEVKCEGLDMGWLSARNAPGFSGWGEKRLKSFITGVGLSSSLDSSSSAVTRNTSKKWFGADQNGQGKTEQDTQRDRYISPGEETHLQVDIKSLFTIGDTNRLAHLVDARDEILENLEIAEALYINSFRTTTPEPSLAEIELVPTTNDPSGKMRISRPRPLGGSRKRTGNPAFASSSLTPTSFIAPSQYYKLRSPQGVSGGRFTTSSSLHLAGQYGSDEQNGASQPPGTRRRGRDAEEPALSASIASRIIGTRFQEISRNSRYGILPMGSKVHVDGSGELGPVHPVEHWNHDDYDFPIPDPMRFGPNFDEGYNRQRSVAERSSAGMAGLGANGRFTAPGGDAVTPITEEWIDVAQGHQRGDTDEQTAYESDWNGGPPSAFARLSTGLKGRKDGSSSSERAPRESFPRRKSQRNGARRGEGTGTGTDTDRDDEFLPPHERLQASAPFVRPLTGIDFSHLGSVYASIRDWRSRLKTINLEIAEAQRQSYSDLAEGKGIKGWLLIGRGLRFIDGIELIHGRAKEDVRWDMLQREHISDDEDGENSSTGSSPFLAILMWLLVIVVTVLLLAGLTASVGLALASAPDVTTYLTFLAPLSTGNTLANGIATILAPAVGAILFISLAVGFIHWASKIRNTCSISGGQLFTFRLTFLILTCASITCIVAVGVVLFAVPVLQPGTLDAADLSGRNNNSKVVADGAIYMSILAFSIVLTAAFVVPGLFLLQPRRLWRIVRAEKRAITPRQRFRAMYPKTLDPTYATGASVLAIVFASTFSVIFPLMAPAVCLLLLLTLIAQRFLVGYVYVRTRSQTGGLLEIWLLKRFATILALQPLLLGLILLTRRFWIEGGVLLGTALFVVLFVELYTTRKERRRPLKKDLSPISRDSLGKFEKMMQTQRDHKGKATEEDSLVESGRAGRATTTSGFGRGRGSMASVLEMMSLTLAVMPSPSRSRAAVPLSTETLDDLTATERAARTHPDTPPHLPPLPFTEHAEDMASILYAPELIAPPPIIWLPNDGAGVARSEAIDLQKYHDLRVTIDVRTVTRAQDEIDRLPR